MGSNSIIVREYLESLSEDKELDYLFPILLNLMGFKIITTARESKGQPQYGKDIVAIGTDDSGLKKRFYFELKGYTDKDITQTTFLKSDGIRESILEAKITNFDDSSIPGFNQLPVQIVVVHNGVLKSNSRKTFNDFIDKEFPNGGFERWDIYQLTDLFSKYLFSEYLLTDEDSLKLFKRTLVLLDAPDYNQEDFKKLVILQIEKIDKVEGRSFKKFFASMNLLSIVILHYAKENDNLTPARDCISFLLLNVWAMILDKGLEKKKPVKREFNKLLHIHFQLLDEYFQKTEVARKNTDGLFSERGGLFETLAYPVRCFDYISYLIYYFELRLLYPKFDGSVPGTKLRLLIDKQIICLVETLNNNKGSARPLLDNHSIALMSVFRYLLENSLFIVNPIEIIRNYITEILSHILITHNTRGRFPEMYNNMEALTEFYAINARPAEYHDSSSLLIRMLFEMLAVIDAEDIYTHFQLGFAGKVDLQTAHLALPDDELESLMFKKNLQREMHVEASLKLPEEFEEFKKAVLAKPDETKIYKTDLAGLSCLRTLAHIYYENEYFVDEWRKYQSK